MAFACENVVSESGGPVSFQNVMDGIAAFDFPATTGRWFVIFCFFSPVAATLGNCRVVIEDESGELIAQTALKDLTFTQESQISRNVVGFQGLAWPYPSRYFIKFLANRDDVLGCFPMLVTQADIPPAESGDEPA